MDTLTLAGNLAGDPELRYTSDGRPVANFTVCSTPRFYDRASGEYRDGETLFMACSMWTGAENVAESLHRGDRVVVTGRVKSRSYETKDEPPQKRTVVELTVDEVGPSLKWATARVTKTSRSSGAADAGDPWAAAPDAAPSLKSA